MDYKLSITDDRLLAGLTAVLARYNAETSQPLPDESAYLDYVINSALESYATQFVDPPQVVKEWIGKQADAVAAVQAILAKQAQPQPEPPIVAPAPAVV